MDWAWEVGHRLWLGSCKAPAGEVLYADATGADGGPNLTQARLQASALPPVRAGCLRCVCLSDTHERHTCVDVPPGDVLLLAGDVLAMNRHFSTSFSVRKLEGLARWIAGVGAGAFKQGKYLIGGNHDAALEALGAVAARKLFDTYGVTYLEDSGATIVAKGAAAPSKAPAVSLDVWGSPVSRGHSANDAFQSRHDERIRAMPQAAAGRHPGTQGGGILLTHGPLPDSTVERLAPRLHVSGHVHECHGVRRLPGGTVCVNASIMDGRYNPSQVPIVVDIRIYDTTAERHDDR